MDPNIVSALIALFGVLLGLLCRDLLFARHLLRVKRDQAIEDQDRLRRQQLEDQERLRRQQLEDQDRARRQELERIELDRIRDFMRQERERFEILDTERRTEQRHRHDIVRQYADPLLRTSRSLNFRLRELLKEKGRAAFLLASPRVSDYDQYKWISTNYRLASLLGWIRAFRRERSLLDPMELIATDEVENAIDRVESALADGFHVEDHRLRTLLGIWRVESSFDDVLLRECAVILDNELRSYLTQVKQDSTQQLDPTQKATLSKCCAKKISARLAPLEIPESIVVSKAQEVAEFLDIKQAYLYRDWQAAIGDFMIRRVEGSRRLYDVIGYGDFESKYLDQEDRDMEKRWITRLGKLLEGLDLSVEGPSDARRFQLNGMYEATSELERELSAKIASLQCGH